MISSVAGTQSYYSNTVSASGSSRTLTPADALEPTAPDGFRIDVSQVRPLTGATPISAQSNPELRDLLATAWLLTHRASSTPTGVPDNAPQNTYAQVKVGGKVVATVYNSGVSEMSNATAAAVGGLQDPPGLSGPNLAQWRAERYAKLLGGTVEKAPTAITQAQWTPRPSVSESYSREQLDAAFQAMLAEGQSATARRQSSYEQAQAAPARHADVNA